MNESVKYFNDKKVCRLSVWILLVFLFYGYCNTKVVHTNFGCPCTSAHVRIFIPTNRGNTHFLYPVLRKKTWVQRSVICMNVSWRSVNKNNTFLMLIKWSISLLFFLPVFVSTDQKCKVDAESFYLQIIRDGMKLLDWIQQRKRTERFNDKFVLKKIRIPTFFVSRKTLPHLQNFQPEL